MKLLSGSPRARREGANRALSSSLQPSLPCAPGAGGALQIQVSMRTGEQAITDKLPPNPDFGRADSFFP